MISIVDDDESVRMATRRLVLSLGYVGHAFASADAFLRSPHLDETTCLIVDVQMPGIGGVDLLRLLAARNTSIPAIVITAFPDEKIRARAMGAGAVAFLSKPCDGSALVRCIEACLEKPSDEAR